MTDLKPAPNGWIILDKPRGLGSTQAVAAMKRNLREGGYAKTKVGHGGTLDPLAEGVLPIALGEATKLAGRMLDASKIYDFTVKFGEETSTLDSEGEVVQRSDVLPFYAQVHGVLAHFMGDIEQIPPAYSAIKVDGRRAYDRARAGEAVELKKRSITVHRLTLVGAEIVPRQASRFEQKRQILAAKKGELYGEETLNSITLRAHVSKGTYIRSLARDIADALGTCGYVTYLRREKAGPFAAKDAISLDNLNEIGSGAPLNDLLLPLEAGLDDIPALNLDQTDAQAVRAGRVLSDLPQSDGLYCAMLDNVPVALVELIAGTSKIVRGFNLPDVAE